VNFPWIRLSMDGAKGLDVSFVTFPEPLLPHRQLTYSRCKNPPCTGSGIINAHTTNPVLFSWKHTMEICDGNPGFPRITNRLILENV